ncbi:hypothetical protein [Algiphilus sp.]|uniref:hypothetical protein n=2 Tax=Algiphilus sp. TaxID=1872431 RepID=UPI003C312EEC
MSTARVCPARRPASCASCRTTSGSRADAERLIAAALAVQTEFSAPDTPLEDMRVERDGDTYYFVDGERFGDATGYRVDVDGDGRVTAFAYDDDLPVAPLASSD